MMFFTKTCRIALTRFQTCGILKVRGIGVDRDAVLVFPRRPCTRPLMLTAPTGLRPRFQIIRGQGDRRRRRVENLPPSATTHHDPADVSRSIDACVLAEGPTARAWEASGEDSCGVPPGFDSETARTNPGGGRPGNREIEATIMPRTSIVRAVRTSESQPSERTQGVATAERRNRSHDYAGKCRFRRLFRGTGSNNREKRQNRRAIQNQPIRSLRDP